MSLYVPCENKLLTCPYDEAHRVKESRFQLHIAKCKLNHLDFEKKICPFNASHLLQQGEYDHHLVNCPDRGALDLQLSQTVNKNNPYKGRTDVPQYSDPLHSDESWEIENTVLDLAPPPPGAVIEPPPMAKPAERRRLYKELHQLDRSENDKNSPLSSKSSTPRQPKQPSETQMLQNTQPNVHLQNLGLGRGKPTSRIAANFTAAQDRPAEDARYSSVVKNMSNLGLGRGQPVKKDPTPSSFDDDFPALGCGRGAFSSKQSPRTPGAKPEK